MFWCYYAVLLVLVGALNLCSAFDCDQADKLILVNGTRLNESQTVVFLPNLTDALDYVQNHKQWQKSTCIKIYTPQTIQRRHALTSLHNFSITGNTDVGITCINSPQLLSTGLSITNSINVTLKNMNFVHCGASAAFESDQHHLVAGVWLEKVSNVKLELVHFDASYGYGMVLIDAMGNTTFSHITILNSIFVSQSKSVTGEAGFMSGGGLVMIYHHTNGNVTSSNQIYFNQGKFQNNNAVHETLGEDSEENSLMPVGVGGGLSFIFGHNVQGVNVKLFGVNFHSNKANRGGGVFIRFLNQSFNNNFTFEKCLFDSNYAKYTGGGVSVQGQQSNTIGNKIIFHGSFFEHNNATIGGGYQYSQPRQDEESNNKNIVNETQFSQNYAVFGAAIQVMHTKLDLLNVTLLRNSNKKQLAKGALASYQATIEVFGSANIIRENNNTGFVLDNTMLVINNGAQLNLTYNVGTNGGAMSLFGNSKVVLKKNSLLYFGNNFAESQGGAMYVLVAGPPLKPFHTKQLNRYDCFFQLADVSMVEFKDNAASTSEGNSIFASTLQNCIGEDLKLDNVFTNWTDNMKFDVQERSIVTTPVNLQLDPLEWSKCPGRELNFNIKLLDERGNNVSGTVDVTINSSNVGIKENYTKFVVSNNMIEFSYIGSEKENFSLAIAVPDSGVEPHTLLLQLQSCPFGYVYHNVSKTCKCKQMQNTEQGIAQCFENELYLYRNRWVLPSPKRISMNKNIAHECPKRYCKSFDKSSTLTGAESLYDSLHQCRQGRKQSSRLCSECNASMSVHLRPGNCSNCHGKNRYLVEIVHPIFTFLVTAGIIWLNKETFASFLNPVIYSYQIIGLILPAEQELPEPIFFLTVLVGGSFNHGIYDSCFLNGMNDLHRLWFYLINPIYWILSCVLCYVLFVCIKSIQNFISRDAFFRSINTLFFVCCCSIFKFAFNALNYVNIDDEYNVFVYAKLRYLHGEHKFYFTLACILIGVVFSLCVIIFASTCHQSREKSCDDVCCCYCCYFCLRPCLERSFKYGFKTHKKIERDGEESMQWNMAFFSLFYVVSSCCIMGVSIFMTAVTKLIVVNILSVLFMSLFILCAPYKESYMNHFDTVMLANVIVMINIIDANPYPDVKMDASTLSLTILLFIPILSLLLWLLYHVLSVCGYSNFRWCLRRGHGSKYPDIPWRLRNDTCDHK